ncbi:MAG: aspartate--tRNA(Asn) ligase [bacterium]|nr:aspartate--tRNA(Asn) ligase [bacterium]
MRVLSNNVSQHTGKEIKVQGWLHKKRLLGGLNFIVLRDRGGLIQIVVEEEAEVEKLRGLQTGTVMEIIGKVYKEERATGGAEIREPKITVLVPVTDESPIEIDKPLSHKSENLDTLFDNRVIGLRNLNEQAIFKIQSKVLEAVDGYFHQNDFVEMNTPKLLAGATEGGAEVFKLDYFGKEATLAQSAQFYKQMMVGVFERVFEINPTYRAEPSATTRHMTEYITIDAEMGFVTFEELREFAGGMLKFIVDKVWKDCEAELKMWDAQKPVLANPIPSMTMAKIHELYTKQHGVDTTKEDDLRPDEEKWICEYAKKNLKSEAVFVTEWPISSMKFYHKVNEQDPKVADRSDLLFRGVEIATVPMREHRYEVLVEQLKAMKGNPEAPGFKYYLQAFQYGLPPHGGFGWGLERTVEKMLGLDNVKEATLFPRDINRLTP